MNYKIKIREAVPHHRLPSWCPVLIANIKGVWNGFVITDPDSVLVTISSDMNKAKFQGKNGEVFYGAGIRREIVGRELVVYAMGSYVRELFRVGFEPTDKKPDPFFGLNL